MIPAWSRKNEDIYDQVMMALAYIHVAIKRRMGLNSSVNGNGYSSFGVYGKDRASESRQLAEY